MTQSTPNQQTKQKNNASEAKAEAPKAFDAKAEGFVKHINTSVEHFYNPQLKSSGALQAIQGYVIDTRERPVSEKDLRESPNKKPSVYHIVMLTKPLVAVNEDKQEVELHPGDKVWMDERYDTIHFRDFAPRRDFRGMPMLTEIRWEPQKKKNLKGGHTMWVGESFSKHFEGTEIAKLGLRGLIPERDLRQLQAEKALRQLPAPAAEVNAPEAEEVIEDEIPF